MNLQYLASQVGTLLQTKYPGGLHQFSIDGGILCSIKTNPIELHLFHPSMPEEVAEVLTEVSNKLKFKLQIINQINTDEARDNVINTLKKLNISEIISVDFNIPTAVITVHDDLTKKNKKDLKTIGNINGLNSLLVVQDSKVLIRIKKDIRIESVVPTKSKRGSISDDDLINLKIALETMTIDELIKEL